MFDASAQSIDCNVQKDKTAERDQHFHGIVPA
jgi:hypothetical protein